MCIWILQGYNAGVLHTKSRDEPLANMCMHVGKNPANLQI